MNSRKQIMLLCNKYNPLFGNNFYKKNILRMRGTIKELATSVLIRAQLEIRRELVFLRT